MTEPCGVGDEVPPRPQGGTRAEGRKPAALPHRLAAPRRAPEDVGCRRQGGFISGTASSGPGTWSALIVEFSSGAVRAEDKLQWLGPRSLRAVTGRELDQLDLKEDFNWESGQGPEGGLSFAEGIQKHVLEDAFVPAMAINLGPRAP